MKSKHTQTRKNTATLEDASLPHLSKDENLLRWLHDFQGHDLRTIARTMRVKESALQNRLSRIHKKVSGGLTGMAASDKRRKKLDAALLDAIPNRRELPGFQLKFLCGGTCSH